MKENPDGSIAFFYRLGDVDSGINAYADAENFVHVGFRPSQGKIVLNTFSSGEWGAETNVIGSIGAGLYELTFDFPSWAVLRFDLLELLSLSLVGRSIALSPRLHSVSSYGNICVFTPGAEFVVETPPMSAAMHPYESELLGALRGRGEGFMETLQTFDFQCYLDLNPDLHGSLDGKTEAIAHFLTHGIRALRQFSDAEKFDARFYQSRYEDLERLSAADAYLHWLSVGRREGRSSCETMWLGRLGLSIPELPSPFTADGYASSLAGRGLNIPALRRTFASADRSSQIAPPDGRFRTKWDAFEHWIDHIEAVGGLDGAMGSAVIFKELADVCARDGRSRGAIDLYRRSLELDETMPETWQHLGDALLRQSDYAPALEAYSKVIALDAATYWTHRNLIKAKQGLGEVGAALESARLMAAIYPERVELEQLKDELGLELFELHRNRARSAVIAGNRSEAYAHIASIFRDPELPIAPTDGVRSGPARVLIFGTPYLRQCMFYRIEQKLEQLRFAGFDADFIPQDEPLHFMSAAGTCDAAIFFRVPALPLIEKAILYCRRIGVTTFYETDDLVFDTEQFPDTLQSYRGALSVEEYADLVVDAPLFKRAMSLCEYGIASTPALQRRMESIVAEKRCFLHRNVLDNRHERFLSAIDARGPKPDRSEVRLFYATGTKAHNEDFEVLAAPAIAKLFQREPRLQLITMGFLPLPALLRPFSHRITQLPPNWDTELFWSVLASADINLSVVKSGPFSDCKSEIKWIEAAMLGLPSVLSSTSTYTDFLSDGHDAMLADSVESWERKLSELIDSRELRSRIGHNARELVRSRYDPASGAGNIAEIVHAGLKNRSESVSGQVRKPLILLVNVYFWPQTIGGGTRVLKDNLDYLCEHFGAEFDFQVFCGVEGAGTAYETRTYFYRGVRVTSVTYPMRAGMDWLPVDEEIGGIFRSHLDLWKPSLIHFHGIQRLSVCIVEAAQELHVPYVVTLHDGWWISDYQFLVNEKGTDVSEVTLDPIECLQLHGPDGYAKINRSLRLRTALAGAKRVLSVSAAFEKVHRKHGVTNIVTIENGVSELNAAKRRADHEGLVRLGYVGNIATHKGYTLVKRALMSTRFDNLSLTVVDHALSQGERSRNEIWGTTPVRTIGKVPQSKVVELYDTIDVLLAPSIWPESYGLVAREALAAGLWVIASNRGAIGADVVPGENGFVIDVGDTAELVTALSEIDRDPTRYRASPAVKPVLRKADEQARELAALYRELLCAAGDSVSDTSAHRRQTSSAA